MIEAESLTKKYPASQNLALDSVSFSARQGEIVGLLGENGAGKSTLLMILSTLLKPTSGRARLCGMDISTAGGLARSRIGLLLDGQRLYEALTGRENIAYFAALQGMNAGIRRCNQRALRNLRHGGVTSTGRFRSIPWA
jgi:sodium transport system ATP-binding protein